MKILKKILCGRGFLVTCLGFGAALLFACCGNSSGILSRKSDSALMQCIEELESKGLDAEIQVIGRCAQKITAEMSSRMRDTGINLETCTEDLFSATGNKQQLEKLAKLSFVQRLELSQRNKMN